MRRTSQILILSGVVAALASGCTPRRPTMAQTLREGLPEPRVGMIRAIDERGLVIQMPGGGIPQVFARTADTVVASQGTVIQWEALEVGQPIRIQAVEGIFDPPALTVVEQLHGLQAEAVEREVQGLGGRGCPCPQPERQEGAPPPTEAPAGASSPWSGRKPGGAPPGGGGSAH